MWSIHGFHVLEQNKTKTTFIFMKSKTLFAAILS